MNKLESINLIYRNPNIRGGRPCILGTGLRVIDIVMSMQFGNRSPEQIANDYQVSLGRIHAALAYYYENKEEIDDDIREDIRIGEELVQEGFGKPEKPLFSAEGPSEISDKLRSSILMAIEESANSFEEDIAKYVSNLANDLASKVDELIVEENG